MLSVKQEIGDGKSCNLRIQSGESCGNPLLSSFDAALLRCGGFRNNHPMGAPLQCTFRLAKGTFPCPLPVMETTKNLGGPEYIFRFEPLFVVFHPSRPYRCFNLGWHGPDEVESVVDVVFVRWTANPN